MDTKKAKADLQSSQHTTQYCVYILYSGQTDMRKLKAGLQSSQHTEFCIVSVCCDGHEEGKGRSAEQSAHKIVYCV